MSDLEFERLETQRVLRRFVAFLGTVETERLREARQGLEALMEPKRPSVSVNEPLPMEPWPPR